MPGIHFTGDLGKFSGPKWMPIDEGVAFIQARNDETKKTLLSFVPIMLGATVGIPVMGCLAILFILVLGVIASIVLPHT